MRKILVLLALLVAFAGTASAVSMTGNFSIKTRCFPGTPTTYALENDSGEEKTYTISAVGENREWITVNGVSIGRQALEVVLDAGESTELYAYVKPQDCYVAPGTYTILIRIENSSTITKEIEVEVEESLTIGLTASPAEAEASQCEETGFEVKAENNGKQAVVLDLLVEGIPDSWVEFSSTSFLLESGKSKAVEMRVQPPCNAEAKEHDFTVTGVVKVLGEAVFEVSSQAALELQDRQGIEISFPQMGACKERETTGKARVKNTGLLSDELQLSVSGLGWASVSPKSMSLEAGEEKTATISFEETGAKEGKYGFKVKAVSEKFGKETEKAVAVELRDCYSLVLGEITLDGRQAGQKPRVCLEETPAYRLGLENTGIETVEAKIGITGADSIASPGSIRLAPGESKTVSLKIDLSGETAGEKAFTVSIVSDTLSLEKKLEFVAEDCYALSVDWGSLGKEVELDANCETMVFTIGLENAGAKQQDAVLSLQGPNWVSLNPKQLKVPAGGEKEAYVYMAPPYDVREGKHKASVSVNARDAGESRQVTVNVYGGLYAELGTAHMKSNARVNRVTEEVERTVEVSLALSNDGNALLKVNSLEVGTEFETTAAFSPVTLQPSETVEVPLTLYLEKREGDRFTLPLKIGTDKGELHREVQLDLSKEGKQEALVGLFGLGVVQDALLLALFIIVVVLAAIAALRYASTSRKDKTGLSELAKEVQQIPGKKLEEIGGKGKKEKGKKGKGK